MNESKRKFLLLYGLKVFISFFLLFIIASFLVFFIIKIEQGIHKETAKEWLVEPDILEYFYHRNGKVKESAHVVLINYDGVKAEEKRIPDDTYRNVYEWIERLTPVSSKDYQEIFGAPLIEIALKGNLDDTLLENAKAIFPFTLEVGGLGEERGNLLRIEINADAKRKTGKKEFVYFRKKGLYKELKKIVTGLP